jgi:cytochrome c553
MLVALVRAFLVATFVAYGALVHAQGTLKEPAPGPNDACLMCHGDADAKAASGKRIAVDAKQFTASVHGGMSLPCAACHDDSAFGQMPHGTVKPAQCASCHEKAVKEYSATIHGRARAGGNQVAASCANCHGTHDILKSADAGSRTSRANIEATCAACHGNAEIVQRAGLPGGNVASMYHDSIHGQAMAQKTSAREAVPTCTSCHGAHDMRPKSDAGSRVGRANIPATCGACHMNVKETWEKSEHGKLRQDKQLHAPGCTDCHSAHQIKQHQDPKFRLAVTDQCGTCHAEFASTYRDTFHGQVTQLGFAQIATCASCHGGHTVLPKDNPASKVSAQNRLATCQQCHPKANANFVSFDPHANKHSRDRGQVLFFAGKFMDLLLLGVFSVFGVHTLLWFVRSLKAMRERRGAPPPRS